MVLVLFSVTFFTETNQKRHKGKLVIHQGDISNFIAVSLPAAPLRSPPYSMRVLARRLYRRQPWLRYHILLKGPLFYLIYFGSKLPNTFDTDGIGV
jgi:hypothetical protein